MQPQDADPKGLIRESYRIEGITEAECRSIFVDWALSLPVGVDQAEALRSLIAGHGREGHPMTTVLSAGLAESVPPRRRGGRAGRMAER
ncbi:hypothetical protein [Halodurantibacterium flavum]|uniref:Uncharacterized protein n=1 Tax=Halodurantibacterium flavum TaxID=1382802 RepID=A0ABW4SA19_9RHOB